MMQGENNDLENDNNVTYVLSLKGYNIFMIHKKIYSFTNFCLFEAVRKNIFNQLCIINVKLYKFYLGYSEISERHQ